MKKILFVLALLLVVAAATFLIFTEKNHGGSGRKTAYDAYAKGDYQTAYEIWLTSADKDSAAQYGLGKLYANGQGVAQSDSTARDWWQKSMRDIEQSRVLLSILPEPSDPQYTYATLHEKWQPAAAAGDADAQYKLAILYSTGIGVPQNDTKALVWFEKAANQNHAAAQYELGKFHEYKRGRCAAAQAIQWWEKASALGNADAQNILALKYDMGYHWNPHYPQDECRAIALLEQAIANGGEHTRKQAESVLYALEHNGRYPTP